MPASHLDLVSHWRIKAPVERVWAVLTDLEGWPGWWPSVREAGTLRQAHADGSGGVCRITCEARMPRRIEIEIEIVEALRPDCLRCRLQGSLRGEGIWLLRPEKGFTDLTCVWRVEIGPRRKRWLNPMLVPLLRWNHETVMRLGDAGLARHLAG